MTTQQNGNALWMILIAIALIGALTAMFSRSSTTSDNTGDTERLAIGANEVIRYAKSIELAVQNLQGRGCSENELSFATDHPGAPDYTNSRAPDNGSCDLFKPSGAGLTFQPLRTGHFTAAAPDAGRPVFTVAYNVKATNSADSDLLLVFNNLTKNICLAVNRQLGIANPDGDAPEDVATVGAIDYAKGGFNGALADALGDDAGEHLAARTAGCVKRIEVPSTPVYQYFHVLIDR